MRSAFISSYGVASSETSNRMLRSPKNRRVRSSASRTMASNMACLPEKWLYSDASLMPTAAAMSRTDTAWKPRDANNANASSTMRSFVSFPRMVSPLQN